jgi:cytochrome c oxidase assembly protein subunit 15
VHRSPTADMTVESRTRGVVTFPRLVGFTAATTLTLVSLGVYTSATGSGLACSAQWPLCDGGVLPRSVPSFIEWFHRLVAMVAGFLILGVAAWSWRAPAVDRRTAVAATTAGVLLPLQVSVGAVTVTLSGLVPGGYAVSTHAAHLAVALAIFTALTVASLRALEGSYDGTERERARRALVAAAAVVAVAALFSRVVPLVPYAPAAQATFVGVGLAGYASLVAAVRWLPGRSSARVLGFAAAAAVLVALVLGRDVVLYTATAQAVNAAALALAVTFAVVAAVLVDPATGSPDGPLADDRTT